MIETGVNLVLFVMLVLTAFAIVAITRLFAVVMLASVFSLLSALLFVALDAVDVAFTEAAVGAGITTVLMLGTIALTSRVERPSRRSQLVPFLVVLVVGAGLFYGTLEYSARTILLREGLNPKDVVRNMVEVFRARFGQLQTQADPATADVRLTRRLETAVERLERLSQDR